MHRSRRLYPRALGTAAALAVVCVFALTSTPAPAFAARVFVDPGHGGPFPGATYQGVEEANVNLAFARELEAALRASGHATAMSRIADVGITNTDIPTWTETDGVLKYSQNGVVNLYDDLQARCDKANTWGADVFVSIHANAAGASSANGAETFWRDTSTTDRVLSQRLASFIQQEYVLETGLVDRGVKANRFYVLRWSNMPAVLVETGFMSNSTELRKLIDPSFQRKGARAIARGIDRFLATDPFTPVYPRLAGTNRFETAARVAERGWSGTGGTVILASGTNWPDALSGTPLSRPMNAPVLLTGDGPLPQATGKRIAAQSPTRILVLGGEGAVSSGTVAAAVAATGHDPESVTTERIAGEDRFGTATEIARRVRIPADGRVFVASGRDFADALSVGSYAGADGVPILLVEPDAVPDATRTFITEHAGVIRHFQIIGGPAAVSPRVEEQLRAHGTVRRIWGANRFRTNLAVMATFAGTGRLDPLVASATSFPDALSAATLASRTRRPVILVGERHLPAHTREFLYNNRSRTADPTVVGGPAAVAYQTDWMIRKGFGR